MKKLICILVALLMSHCLMAQAGVTDNNGSGIAQSDATTLTITNFSVPAAINANSSTTFTVAFDPSAAGMRTTTISIANDDSDENSDTFTIQGTGSNIPTNDDCSNATSLTVGADCTTGTTQNASTQNGEYICISPGGGITPKTVWYRFTATNDSLVLNFTITNYTNCATVLGVYGAFSTGAGCLPNAGNQILCQNMGLIDPGYHPLLTGLTIGQDYLVQVQANECGGGNDAFANFCIGVGNPTTNSFAGGATLVPACGGAFASNNKNSYWGNGTSVGSNNLDNNNSTTVTGASETGDDVTFAINNIAWYKVCNESLSSQQYSLTINNITSTILPSINNGIQAAIFTGTPTNLTNIGSSPSRVEPGSSWSPLAFNIAASSCAYLIVDGFAGDIANYDITVTATGATYPEIQIQGNSTNINDGATTTSTTNYTDFGLVAVNGNLTRTFTVQNTSGTAALSISSITSSDPLFTVGTLTYPVNVATNGSTTFTVSFNPTASGLQSSTISVYNNDCDEGLYTFMVEGTGDNNVPEINLKGNGISIASGETAYTNNDHRDFGSVDVSSGTIVRTFTIENTGSGDLTIPANGITKSGTHQSNFTIGGITLPATIPANSSTTFTVTFDPSAAGMRTATISIANDDANEGSYTFSIKGIGTSTAEFITQWNLATAGSANTSGTANLSIGTVSTGGTVSYYWQEVGGSGASGSGTFSGATLSITGLPINATIDLGILPTNFQRIHINNGTDKSRLVDVKQWGTTAWTSMQYAFRGCNNLSISATDIPTLSSVSNYSYMFASCSTLNGPSNINSWNVSSATDMLAMFNGATAFNKNIDTWSVGGVINMSVMFSYATNFNQDISNWNVSSATSMVDMFSNTTQFNQDISNWNVSSVASMINMFSNATAFNRSLAAWGAKFNANVNLTNFLDNCGMSLANYDATLTGFNAGTVTGRSLGAAGLQYCASAADRANLVLITASGGKGWTITGDAPSSTCLPEINLKGNGTNIASGETAYTNNDHRDFGSVNVTSGTVVRTFTIENTGSGSLNISGISKSGTNPADFTIGGISLPATINANSSTTFTVTFDPSAAGMRTATISIANDDANENPYTFAIRGYGETPFITTWKTDNAGTSSSTSITIPTTGTGYNYDVDWNNDGTFDEFGKTGSVTHDYGVAGTYQVAIRGSFPQIYFSNGGDKLKLLSIDQWGSIAWTSMSRAFYGCANMVLNATDVPNTSAVTNMSYMFSGCTTFNQALPEGFNPAAVTNMSAMFNGCSAYNQALPSTFNTAAVTDMSGMFNGCGAYNQALPSSFNTAAVTNMSQMFNGCSAYDQALPSNFNTAAVTSMYYMFSGCGVFNQVLPISFNTTAVTEMSGMFRGCSTYNQALPSSFNTSAVTNMSYMFHGCAAYNQALPSNFNTAAVTNMSYMFYGCSAYDQVLPSNFNTAAVTNMSFMFYGCSAYDQVLPSNFNTAAVTDMTGMFRGCSTYNQALPSSFNTSAVTNMSQMFWGCSTYNQALPSSFNTSLVTDMSNMFYNCGAYNQALPSTFNTSAVTNMRFMFYSCDDYNQVLPSNFNTSAVTDMSLMFYGCSAYNQALPSNFTVAAVTDMSSMFRNATVFNQSLAAWGTQLNANVNLSNMLNNCGMSVANYDATLTGFNAGTVTGRSLGAAGLQYCASAADRDNLVLLTASGGKGWTITGDAPSSTCLPEINLKGNGISIVNGETAYTNNDHRDFGSVNVTSGTVVRTFTIENTGSGSLNISGISKSGTNPADFTIGGISLPATINANSSTTFTVTFDPSAAGMRTATVSIANNDANENPYTFDIKGTGINPDYTITTTGNVLTITDISGNGEMLDISQNSTNNIRFSVSGRTYSIDNGSIIAFNTTPADVALATITSIVVNTAAGDDIISVGAFTANLPNLSINGGVGNDAVSFNGDITFASNSNLDVDLQNDDATPGTDLVTFGSNVNLILSGTGMATLKVSQKVTFGTGSSLETTDGDLTIEANQQATPTSGSFFGVSMYGVVRINGTGNLVVKGKGGDTGASQYGIFVTNAGLISGGTSGSVSVQGTGGASSGISNFGVYVVSTNSQITSAGANVSVTGIGGGTGASGFNTGISLLVGQITAGGNGTVTVQGTGGAGSGNDNDGVAIASAGSQIASSGGNVSVTGIGGGTGTSGNNDGVNLQAASKISAGGTGTVTVNGTGGTSSGNNNYGIYVANSNSQIISNDGSISLTGQGGGTGTSANNYGVYFDSGAQIAAGGSGTLTIQGTGGTSTGNNNHGVNIANSSTQITSGGGNVSVTGTGGGTGTSTSRGVVNGGKITAGGSGTVTVQGTGGNGSGGQSFGVLVTGTNSQITSGGGNVSVTGQGNGTDNSSQNMGVYINSEGQITAGGNGTVTVNGTGSTNTTNGANHGVFVTGTNSQITSSGGNVSVTGTGGGTGVSGVNYGVYLFNGQITAGGNGTVTVQGTAGAGSGNDNDGVAISGAGSQIASSGGNVSVTGIGGGTGTSGSNDGVNLQAAGKISAGGTGTVTVNGTGGTSSGNDNYGVYVANSNSQIISNDGSVSLTGQGGGTGTSVNNYGVYFNTGAQIVAGGSGTLTIQGTGGASTGNSNHGVNIANSSTQITSGGGNVSVTGTGGGTGPLSSGVVNRGKITAGGSGTVTVQGTGGNGSGGQSQSFGVWVTGTDSQITSGGGNVSVTGQGNGTGSFNPGVHVSNAGQITAGGNGTVTVNGTGSTNSTNNGNYGIYISDANSQITSSGGNVSVTGLGGGSGTSSDNVGIFIGTEGEITAGGTGTVTVNGTGATTTGNGNCGVYMYGSNAQITSNNGDINVLAQGGGSGSSSGNHGSAILSGSKIIAGGSGNVMIQANGGATSGGANYGINMQNSGTLVSSSGGNVTINAVGGGIGASNSNFGANIIINAQVSAGGSGNVSITGQGGNGTGTSNYGVRIAGSGTQITTGGGNLTITGIEGSGNSGTGIDHTISAQITTATNGGNITLIANSMNISSTVATQAGGTTTLRPYTNGVQINLGTATDAIGGPLGLSDTELDQISTGTLIIGDGNSGNLTVSAAISLPAATNVQLVSSGDLNISGGGFNTNGGTLLLDPGTSPKAVKPTFNGTDVTASTLSFGSDLQITINGTTLGDGTGSTYTQLSVAGSINLTGVDLLFTGSYVPVGGNTFIVVENDGADAIVGNFTGLTEGTILSNFRGSGLNATISYVGGSGNDVVITVLGIPEINLKGNGISIVNGETAYTNNDHRDFGSVDVSSGNIIRTFTIENTGSGNLTILANGITLSGTNQTDFTIGGISLPATINANSSTTFTVTFDPSVAGMRTATVSIDNDDANENPYTFDIQGTGTCDLTASAGTSTPSVCVGQNISLTVTAGDSYTWAGPTGSGYSSNSQNPIGFTATSTNFGGIYSVTVSTTTGCSSTSTVSVNVNANPTAGINPSGTSICAGGTINLNGTGGSSYSWNSSGGTFASTTNEATFSSTASGGYSFTVTAGNGSSCSNTATASVTVNALPTVVISPTNGQVCAGQTLNLSVTSGLSSYSWNSSGGTFNSTTNQAIFSSTTSGGYSFTVTAGNGSSCSNTATASVTVNTLPTVVISPTNGQVCAGETLNLSATNGLNSYSWTSSGGTFNSTTNQATFSSTTSGGYSFTVTVTNSNSCSNTATASVTVNALPTLVISPTNGQVCVGQTLNLSVTSGLSSYSWNSSGGTFASTTNEATFSSTTSGGYSFTVTAGNGSSCSATATASVTVNALPTVLISPTTGQVCVGATLNLSATGGLSSYSWSSSGGTFNSTTNEATFSSISAGGYGFTITATNSNSCSNTATASVTVNALPTVVISPTNGQVCAGQALNLSATNGLNSYSWTSSGGTFNSTTNQATFISTTSGGYSFTVTAGNGSSCSNTAIASVTVNTLPTVVISPTNGQVCIGQTLNLSATNGLNSYSWTSSGGTFNSTTNQATFSSTTSGGYSFTVTAGNGSSCSNTATASVTVNTLPTVVISPTNGQVCAGQALNLSATNGLNSYSWTSSGGTFNSTTNQATFSSTTSGGYSFTVTATVSGGCSITATTSVSVKSNPAVSINLSALIVCAGQSINLTASGGSSYSWNSSGGGSFVSATNQATFSSNIVGGYSFTVTATNSNSCSATATASVTVNTIPTASISPSTTQSICVGATLNLIASGGGLYSWSGPGNFSNTNAIASLNTSSTSYSGVYKVTVGTGICTATATISVNIQQATASINPTSVSICAGGTIALSGSAGNAYSWRGPNNFSSSQQNINSLYTSTDQLGIYSLTVTVGNCTASTTAEVKSNAQMSAGLQGGLVCIGGTIQLTASGMNSYSWTRQASNFSSTLQNPVIPSAKLTDAGAYLVTGRSGSCTGSAMVLVLVTSPTINPEFTVSPSSIAQGAAITLSATSATGTYSWSGPRGSLGSSRTVTINPFNSSKNGTYRLTLTSGFCRGYTEQVLSVPSTARLASGEEDTGEIGMEVSTYPNPTSKQLTVEVKLAKPSSLKLQLYNTTGNTLTEWELSEESTIHRKEIDMSVYKDGLYLLQAQSKDGKQTKRVMKVE